MAQIGDTVTDEDGTEYVATEAVRSCRGCAFDGSVKCFRVRCISDEGNELIYKKV